MQNNNIFLVIATSKIIKIFFIAWFYNLFCCYLFELWLYDYLFRFILCFIKFFLEIHRTVFENLIVRIQFVSNFNFELIFHFLFVN
jgi:hypothetical protein